VLLEAILFAYLVFGMCGFVAINVAANRFEPMSVVFLFAWPLMSPAIVVMVAVVGIPAAFVWLISCLV
jgi:hypothetical protein